MTRLTGQLSEVVIGEGHPLVLVNDQLRVMDQSPAVLARLKAGDLTGLVELARRGQERGMHMVDILVSHPDLDEADLLPAAAAAIRDALGCPVALDSRDPAALEAALKALHPGKALINSITAESDCLSALLPLAKDFGAALVGMPIGHLHGLPQTVQGRLEEAAVILDAAAKFGIPREDVILTADAGAEVGLKPAQVGNAVSSVHAKASFAPSRRPEVRAACWGT